MMVIIIMMPAQVLQFITSFTLYFWPLGFCWSWPINFKLEFMVSSSQLNCSSIITKKGRLGPIPYSCSQALARVTLPFFYTVVITKAYHLLLTSVAISLFLEWCLCLFWAEIQVKTRNTSKPFSMASLSILSSFPCISEDTASLSKSKNSTFVLASLINKPIVT